MFTQDLTTLSYLIAALLVAITVHEFMHAWTANFLGDPTARMQGRISLNPLAHLDIFGTIALFLIGFGWGKPVPINPNNFKNPKAGYALSSIAGLLANLVTASFLSIIYKLFPSVPFLSPLLFIIIGLNIVLMVFNLIPIPPLDGSKVLYLLLPESVDTRVLEVYGPFFLIAIIIFGRGIFSSIIGPAVNGILLILGLPGYF